MCSPFRFSSPALIPSQSFHPLDRRISLFISHTSLPTQPHSLIPPARAHHDGGTCRQSDLCEVGFSLPLPLRRIAFVPAFHPIRERGLVFGHHCWDSQVSIRCQLVHAGRLHMMVLQLFPLSIRVLLVRLQQLSWQGGAEWILWSGLFFVCVVRVAISDLIVFGLDMKSIGLK